MSPRLQRTFSAVALSAAVVVVAAGFRASVATALPKTPAAAAIPLDENPERGVERPPPPRPPTTGERVAEIALEAVGVPYRWGGESPAGGFDCSGLVRWSYGKVGIELPHSSYALHSEGRAVSRARMKPGDVLFFSGLGHVGLYLGRGEMVHAPYSGKNVEVVALGASHYGHRLVAARRVAFD